MSFEEWCTRWESVPNSEAAERYDIRRASAELVEDLDDLLSEEPECVFVHRGDLTIDGPLLIGNDPGLAPDTLYVIDGDLRVNGPMRFLNADVYTPLYVTGSVTTTHLMCLMDSVLLIGGALTVEGLVLTKLYDMGMLVVHDAASADAWLESGDRGDVLFARDLKAHRLSASESEYADNLDRDGAAEKLWKAALEGLPLYPR